MTSPDRNEPCPCGSGRKFKHCHGRVAHTSESAEQRTWNRLRGILDGFPTMMLRFVHETYGPGILNEAWDEFLLWDPYDPGFDPDTPHMQAFMPWFFHRWSPDPMETSVEEEALHDRPPTRVLLERRGRRLDPLLRRYLEACTTTPFSFHEILRVRAGEGFRARDIFLAEEWEVLERSASRVFQRGDSFFGQVVTCDGLSLMEACGPRPIPPGGKLQIIELRERIDSSRNPPTEEALGDWDLELREAYLGITEELIHPTPPALQNTDGEDLAFHRLTFEVESAERTFDALKGLAHETSEHELLEAAERDPEGRLRRISFAWTVPGGLERPAWDNLVLAHLEIDGTRLVAGVNSAERADRVRRMVQERLGDAARYEGAKTESIEDALEPERSGKGAPDPDAGEDPSHSPEVHEHIRTMTAVHYERWVSEELPSLGGLTPLEAVRERAGREKVAALVDQIERGGRRMEPPMDPTVVQTLRERLELD